MFIYIQKLHVFKAWNPEDFGGLSSIRVPKSLLFTPDIVLLNSVDSRLEDKRDVLVVVYNTGFRIVRNDNFTD